MANFRPRLDPDIGSDNEPMGYSIKLNWSNLSFESCVTNKIHARIEDAVAELVRSLRSKFQLGDTIELGGISYSDLEKAVAAIKSDPLALTSQ